MTTSLTPGSARFQRRQRRRRLARWWPWLVGLGLLVLIGLGLWVVAFSALLDVRDVTVRGATSVPAGRVERAAGVRNGVPLARVDLDRVKANVLDLRAVRSARVERHWPHTLAVRITERVPVAALRDRGTYRLVDANGVAFRRVDQPPRDLPVVEVTAWGGSDRKATLHAAASAAAALPHRLADRIERVSARSPDSITLHLADDVRVMWGSAEKSARKAKVLAALLKHADDGEQDVSVYDVSVPELPTTRS